MRVVSDPTELGAAVGSVFVPTMGALHEGHAALLRRARAIGAARGAPTSLSIFVNPTQFGPTEDLATYPRTLDNDLAIAEREGVETVFTPTVATLYPEGIAAANALAARLPLPEVATAPGLEDRCRPGHFAGVQLVVARLFDFLRPAVAIFGEKDWQQLKLVESMVRIAERSTAARWPGLSIIGHPTIREPDGLALSSRNRHLPPHDRERAAEISGALAVAVSCADPRTAERRMGERLEAAGFALDYAVVRDAETLLPVDDLDRPTRALVAARLAWPGGGVRLIDNAAVAVR